MANWTSCGRFHKTSAFALMSSGDFELAISKQLLSMRISQIIWALITAKRAYDSSRRPRMSLDLAIFMRKFKKLGDSLKMNQPSLWSQNGIEMKLSVCAYKIGGLYGQPHQAISIHRMLLPHRRWGLTTLAAREAGGRFQAKGGGSYEDDSYIPESDDEAAYKRRQWCPLSRSVE